MNSQQINWKPATDGSMDTITAAILLPADPPCLCPWARTLWRVFQCASLNRTDAEERAALAKNARPMQWIAARERGDDAK